MCRCSRASTGPRGSLPSEGGHRGRPARGSEAQRSGSCETIRRRVTPCPPRASLRPRSHRPQPTRLRLCPIPCRWAPSLLRPWLPLLTLITDTPSRPAEVPSGSPQPCHTAADPPPTWLPGPAHRDSRSGVGGCAGLGQVPGGAHLSRAWAVPACNGRKCVLTIALFCLNMGMFY